MHDFRSTGHTAVKFRLHFEKLAIIRVKVKKQVINPGSADQDDFGPHLDRFRLERNHGHEAVLLQHILDSDLVVADAALQGVPDKGIYQHFAGVDDQIAAVGAMQGAGADHGEIGHRHTAVLHDMFDPSEEVVVGRVGLKHHRRSLGVLVVHQHIDLVAVKGRLLTRHLDAGNLRLD